MAATTNPISTTELMSSMREAQAASATAAAQTETARIEALNQSSRKAGFEQAEGVNAADIIRLDSLRVMKNTERNANSAAWFGVNPDVADNEIQGLAQSIRSTREELINSATAIGEMKSVGFFDDPLQYIGNQFKLPSAISQHNAKVDVVEINSNALSKLQDAQIKQQSINKATEAITTTEIAAATAAQAANKANALAAGTLYTAQVHNKDFISTVLADKTLSNSELIRTNAAIAQRINDEIQRAASVASTAETYQRMKERTITISNMEKDVKSKADFLAVLKEATTISGAREISWTQWQGMGQKDRDAWNNIMVGMDAGRLATTPVAAMRAYQETGIPLTPAMRKNVVEPLTEIMSRVQASTKYQQVAPGKKQPELDANMNTMMGAEFTREAQNADSSKLYSLLPLKSYGEDPRVQQNPLWQAGGFTETSKNPLAVTSMKTIISTANQLVADKKMTLEQAADNLTDLAGLMTTIRNTTNQYGRMSIPAPTDFKMSVDSGTMLGGASKHDATNRTQNLNYLTKQDAQRAYAEAYAP